MPDKTYVITSSTSGIGLAVLKKIAQGNIVFAGYRNPEHMELIKNILMRSYHLLEKIK